MNNPPTELVQSRRSKNLEVTKSPLPSAPTIQLRKPLHLKRINVPIKNVVSKSQPTYKITRAVAEPKVHPADPSVKFPEFPGTAVREVVLENDGTVDLDNRERISIKDITMTSIQPKECRPVPTLEHGLDRVLFK